MADTTLTRKEYLKRLKELIKEYPEIVAQLKADNPGRHQAAIQNYFESNPEFGLGEAKWRYKKGDYKITGSMPTKTDPGERFILTSSGNDQLSMKATSAKKNNSNSAGNIRNQRLANANGYVPEQALADGADLKDEIRSRGRSRNADHIWEVQEFGPVYEQLMDELESGAITEAEFKSRLETFINGKPGDHVDNIQDLHYASNQTKKDIVDAKNKKLEVMETTNPSTRTRNVDYQNAMNGTNSQQIFDEARYKNMKRLKPKTLTGLRAFAAWENFDLDNINKGLRRADMLGLIAASTMSGPAALATTGLTVGAYQFMSNPKIQQRMGKQLTQFIGERGMRSALKLIPGLDVFLSGQEALGYLQSGRLDQAGIAALSGAIGWIPVVGDGLAASLDLTNTGLDIARGAYQRDQEEAERRRNGQLIDGDDMTTLKPIRRVKI